MTLSESGPRWCPENGFGDERKDDFRSTILTESEDGKEIWFDYQMVEEMREKCLSKGYPQAEFLDDFPRRTRFLFPMNCLALTPEGEFVEDKKTTVADAMMNHKETQIGSNEQIIRYFLQPFMMETPILYLMFIAGPKSKYTSSIEILKVYFSVMHIVQATGIPFCDKDVMATALLQRELELKQNGTFVQNHLFQTKQFQSIFNSPETEVVEALHLFLIQYTLRTINIIERYLLRLFTGGFSRNCSLFLSTGRIKASLDDSDIAWMQKSLSFWIEEFESLYLQHPFYALENPDPPGHLPSRQAILDKVRHSDTPWRWFSVYSFWLMLSTQYL